MIRPIIRPAVDPPRLTREAPETDLTDVPNSCRNLSSSKMCQEVNDSDEIPVQNNHTDPSTSAAAFTCSCTISPIVSPCSRKVSCTSSAASPISRQCNFSPQGRINEDMLRVRRRAVSCESQNLSDFDTFSIDSSAPKRVALPSRDIIMIREHLCAEVRHTRSGDLAAI